MSLMFLDIATIPDFELGARLYSLYDLSDKDIARVMSTKCRENNKNSDKLDQHLRQLACVSALLLNRESISLVSSADSGADEQGHLRFLSTIIDQHKPEIITWDAESILPVLNYRYLAHALPIPVSGDSAVVDLISEITESDENNNVPLHEIAVLAGLPGRIPLSDEEILNGCLQGSHEQIRIQLELNVINTCLIYQRWLLTCGEIDRTSYDRSLQLIKEQLVKIDQTHLTNYVADLASREPQHGT